MHKSRSSFATHLPLKSHAIKKNVNEQINPPFIALFEILQHIRLDADIVKTLNGIALSINKISLVGLSLFLN